jgi:hypothetical protein
MRRMFRLPKIPRLTRTPRPEPPSWSWEEHGHQPYQRAEDVEHTIEPLMVVIAVCIAGAMAARLLVSYWSG